MEPLYFWDNEFHNFPRKLASVDSASSTVDGVNAAMASEAFSEGSICQKGRGDLGRKKSERQATVSCIGAGMTEDGMARKMTNSPTPAQRLTFRLSQMPSQRVGVSSGLGY